jgi:hypothetical protein
LAATLSAKRLGKYTTPQERLNLLPTSGMSATSLKVLGVKAGSSAAPLNYSIGHQSYSARSIAPTITVEPPHK